MFGSIEGGIASRMVSDISRPIVPLPPIYLIYLCLFFRVVSAAMNDSEISRPILYTNIPHLFIMSS